MSEKTITRDLFSDLNKKVTAWVGEKTKEGGTRCCDGRNRWEMSDSAKNATLVVNFKMCGVVRCVCGGGVRGVVVREENDWVLIVERRLPILEWLITWTSMEVRGTICEDGDDTQRGLLKAQIGDSVGGTSICSSALYLVGQ